MPRTPPEPPPSSSGPRRWVQQRTEAVVELLREHPNAGHAIAEFPDLPHRELSAPPYRVFYRVASDTVWIVAVVHARRRPDPPESDSRD